MWWVVSWPTSLVCCPVARCGGWVVGGAGVVGSRGNADLWQGPVCVRRRGLRPARCGIERPEAASACHICCNTCCRCSCYTCCSPARGRAGSPQLAGLVLRGWGSDIPSTAPPHEPDQGKGERRVGRAARGGDRGGRGVPARVGRPPRTGSGTPSEASPTGLRHGPAARGGAS